MHEDNWPSFVFFAELKTQWHIALAPMGGAFYIGIHYPAIQAAFEIKHTPADQREAIFRDVRIMEEAALAVFNKAKD